MAAITAKERFALKKFVKNLEHHRGRHTELVTIYVPQGYELTKFIQQLAQEQGTATNIKSASTRKNVIDALERMIQHLRLFKQTPPNGLACFSGNIAEKEGQSDVQVFSIEPPVPVKTKTYRCDKEFQLDILRDMLDVKEVYGLVVMDRRDATVALLKGKVIIPLVKTHSEVPGKTRAGGQCLKKDTKVRVGSTEVLLEEVEVNDFVVSYDFENNKVINSEVLDVWKVKKDVLYEIITIQNFIKVPIFASEDHKFFVGKNQTKLAKELTTKDLLLNEKYEKIEIKEIKVHKKPTELIDISVKNKNFIANNLIVHNSAQRFERLREGAAKDHYKKVAEYMKEQFLPLKNLKGIIIGGPSITINIFLGKEYLTGDVKKKIIGTKDLSYTGEFGLQELLEKSSDLLAEEEVAAEKKVMQKFFNTLSKQENKVTYGEKETRRLLEMGVVDTLLLSEKLDDSIIEELSIKAEELGSKVMIISVDTTEGAQLKEIGMIAAILRYEVQH